MVGSLEAEKGILDIKFDCSGTRFITVGADSTIRQWELNDSE